MIKINIDKNNRRFKIKKLSIDYPFTLRKEFWENLLDPKNKIYPIVGSNGIYLDRITCLTWIEINGEAWQYLNRKHFEFCLNVVQDSFLNADLKKALIEVANSPFKTKKITDAIYYDDTKVMSRNIFRDTRLTMIKFRKHDYRNT